jgi:hypothetical protein
VIVRVRGGLSLDWARLARLVWPSHPSRWREVPSRLLPTLLNTLRLTTAAVASYGITVAITQGAVDLTGPLTALLVMQASAYSTLKMGAVRVAAVLGGVLIATFLSLWLGLTWWSLGAAIAASLLLGKALRLGDQILETPISAMLILGVSNPDLAAETRILNTLIGAGVGIAFNLLYPPGMPTRSASRAVLRLAEATAAPLDTAGFATGAGPIRRLQVGSWLDAVRTADRRLTEATVILSSLRDSRRMNPRAIGTPDIEPVLSSGVRTLEGCLLSIRALFVVLLAEAPHGDEPEDPYGAELREAFSLVLHDTADCIRGFGALVVAEAQHREADLERELDENLDVLRETQAILVELITTKARDNSAAWLLRGSVLAAVGQILDQLDLEQRARERNAWRAEQERNPWAQLPPFVQAALPHPELPTLRGLPDRSRLPQGRASRSGSGDGAGAAD